MVLRPSRPELVIFIGVQGAGKTSYYRAHFALTHRHVSKDLFPRSARNKSRRQERLIREALEAGESVVLDNTHPAASDRLPALLLARELGAKTVAYFFNEDFERCLERNAERAGRARVPEVALHVARRRLEPPSSAEGFDERFIVVDGHARPY